MRAATHQRHKNAAPPSNPPSPLVRTGANAQHAQRVSRVCVCLCVCVWVVFGTQRRKQRKKATTKTTYTRSQNIHSVSGVCDTAIATATRPTFRHTYADTQMFYAI